VIIYNHLQEGVIVLQETVSVIYQADWIKPMAEQFLEQQ
jgi:hypothetical protein